MKVLWVSANLLGFELLKEAKPFLGDDLSILTLSKDSKTVMYDGVPSSEWLQFKVPVEKVLRIEDSIEKIQHIKPDLVIMCGWRQIVTKELLDIPRLGWIGFHPTLLPRGRGPAPIINSILEGWKKSGLTMFYLTERLDDGDIIAQDEFEIKDDDHAMDVYSKVIQAGKNIVRKYMPLIIKENAPRIKQDHSRATFFNKPKLSDNEIKVSKDNEENIYRKIKALSKPYRGAYIKIGDTKLVIWKASREASRTRRKNSELR